jgi:translation elongation factor EF-1alpha
VGEPLREVKMEEKQIGTVDHFFGNISVSMIRLTDTLKVGDKIRIKGSTSNLVQDVASMQIDRVPAQEAKSGDLISIKVAQKVRKDDAVYKL